MKGDALLRRATSRHRRALHAWAWAGRLRRRAAAMQERALRLEAEGDALCREAQQYRAEAESQEGGEM